MEKPHLATYQELKQKCQVYDISKFRNHVGDLIADESCIIISNLIKEDILH